MHKVLASLRDRKTRAVDRMELVHLKAKSEGRDLTAIEQLKFDLAKREAEDLAGVIHELEGELAAAATGQLAPNEPKRDRFLWMHHSEG